MMMMMTLLCKLFVMYYIICITVLTCIWLSSGDTSGNMYNMMDDLIDHHVVSWSNILNYYILWWGFKLHGWNARWYPMITKNKVKYVEYPDDNPM